MQTETPFSAPDGITLDGLAGILECLNYTVAVLDADQRIAYVNQAGENLLRRTRDSLLGRPAAEALPELMGVFCETASSTGVPTPIHFQRYLMPLEVWVEVSAYQSPCGLLVCAHDITERKVHEQILEGEKVILEMVATGAPLSKILERITALIGDQSASDLCSILLLSKDGCSLQRGAVSSLPEEYNAAIDGLEIGPAVGSCGTAAFTGQRVIVTDIAADPRWAPMADLAVRHGLRACWSQPIIARDGRTVLGTVANYSRHAGPPSSRSLLLLEIAAHLASIAIEQNEHEAQLKAAHDLAQLANKAKDRFLAVLSHELRTPLSPALLLSTSMAGDRMLAPEVRDDARTIQRSIEVQTRLIDDLLDLTRIENDKLVLDTGPLDIHDLICDCVSAWHYDASARNIRILCDISASRQVVLGDRHRLQQVLNNLVKNALKFTPARGVITVRTEDVGDTVAISVADTGAGGDEQTLATMFDPFEQAGRIRESGGLGLGLAICKGLVEAHGGVIRASSRGIGCGMTVTFTLPTILQALPHPQRGGGPAPRADQLPLTILLVDDHHDTLRTMSKLLQRLEHKVITADCVRSALAAADDNKFDLLISDVGLPDGSGTALMQELIKRRPVKGIALTGYGMESDIRQTREAGFSAHLTKPVDFDKLLEAITQSTRAEPVSQHAP